MDEGLSKTFDTTIATFLSFGNSVEVTLSFGDDELSRFGQKQGGRVAE